MSTTNKFDPGNKVLQCWNLALATVAIINMVALWGGPIGRDNGITQWPYFWHFIDAEALWQLGATKKLAAIFIDLLLPATVLTAFLYSVSAGRAGEQRGGVQISLTAIWAIYIVIKIGASGDSTAGVVMLFAPFALGALMTLAGPIVLVFGAVALLAGKRVGKLEIPRLLTIFIPAVFAFSALGLYPSNPYGGTAARNKAFADLCNGAGTKYVQVATGLTIDSTVWLQVKGTGGEFFQFTTLDKDGRILSNGSMLSGFKPKPLGALFIGVGPYRRVDRDPAKAPGSPDLVDTIYPDVIVERTYNKPAELLKAPIHQSAVQVRLAVFVASTKTKIAEMVYVIDRINHRACGANNGQIIDEQSFVHDVLSSRSIK